MLTRLSAPSVLAGSLLVVLVALAGCSSGTPTAPQPGAPVPAADNPTGPGPASIAAATPAPDAASRGPEAPAARRGIAASEPVELYVPALGVHIPVGPAPCPVVGGMIDPDRKRPGFACYYVARDRPYTLPGSDSPDVSVLAGHTMRQGAAAFNPFFNVRTQRFTVVEGDELRLRTVTSGTRWLVYRAVSFHSPEKAGGLAADASVWGTGPLPGRLLTIGCLQPADLSLTSTRNIVIAWQYVGTATGEGSAPEGTGQG